MHKHIHVCVCSIGYLQIFNSLSSKRLWEKSEYPETQILKNTLFELKKKSPGKEVNFRTEAQKMQDKLETSFA